MIHGWIPCLGAGLAYYTFESIYNFVEYLLRDCYHLSNVANNRGAAPSQLVYLRGHRWHAPSAQVSVSACNVCRLSPFSGSGEKRTQYFICLYDNDTVKYHGS